MGTILITMTLFAIGTYVGLKSMGYGSKDITFELDEMYNDKKEMAYAVIKKLKSDGYDCDIVDINVGYPKILVNSKKYMIVPQMCSVKGFPVQVIHLKLCS